MKTWDMMGEYVGEDTAWTELTGGFAGSKYNPPVKGRLVGLRVVVNRQAVTTLVNHVAFRLTCGTFNPNKIVVGGQGSGLQTAPAVMAGDLAKMDWDVDQPVDPGVPITIEGVCIGDTAVTNSCFLYGKFEAGGSGRG